MSARPEEPESIFREVGRFYESLVFPSRRSHAAYARLGRTAPGSRVGDFGCGASLFLSELRGHVPEPIFVDLSMNALRTIQGAIRVRADLRQLPFAAAVYDRILCVGVLHHLPERAGVWDELVRVLRRGGRLVVGVYAPGTFQARLRSAYRSQRSRVARRLCFAFTLGLVWARYAGRLPLAEARLRARDFLEVPYVEYQPAAVYVTEAAGAGLRLVESTRIAAMNILTFERC